jgi:hypothetical protein
MNSSENLRPRYSPQAVRCEGRQVDVARRAVEDQFGHSLSGLREAQAKRTWKFDIRKGGSF